MKNTKSKYYLKNNLIGLIIGGIIFGSLGVYAAVTFPSNEVSFDPSNSTLTSTNVKDAIDELYEKCTMGSETGNQIIEDAGLEKDPYECRYFFTGANPNNYITFNEESWRIISVECDGTIKIMRNDSINGTTMAWDTNRNNSWETATSKEYLNKEYYNSITDNSQKLIRTHDFNIGATYTYRTNTDLENTINNENNKKWRGDIGLISVSEYIRVNSNQNNCGTIYSHSMNSNTCKTTNWIYSIKNYGYALFTITANIEDSTDVLAVSTFPGMGGNVSSYPVVNTYWIIPALYLSPDIKITGGTGTQSDPYTIE